MRASVDNPELLRLFGGKPDQVAALAWMIGISLAGARRHPARLDGRAGLLPADAAGHQRVRRRDARPAQEPAAHLRRRHGAGSAARRTSRATCTSTASSPSSRTSLPALFLFAVVVALPQAQLRIGQVKGIVSAPLPSLPRTLGWSAGLLLFVALLAGALSEANLLLVGTAAAFAHRDAVDGAAHRLRRPRLAGPAHLRRRRRAHLRQARRAEPLRAARLGARLRRGRCAGGAAGAPADRSLPRPGHARVRRRSWTRSSSRPTGPSASTALLPAGRLSFARPLGQLHRRLRVRDDGLPGARRAGPCCCSAAASSAGCSSRPATARPPAAPSASTCAGSGSGCSRSRPGWPDSAVRSTPGCAQNIGSGDFIYFNSLLLLLFAVVAGSRR